MFEYWSTVIMRSKQITKLNSLCHNNDVKLKLILIHLIFSSGFDSANLLWFKYRILQIKILGLGSRIGDVFPGAAI